MKESLSAQEAGGSGFGLDRIILPLSSLAGWGMVVVSILTSMHVLGINIQPLLTVTRFPTFQLCWTLIDQQQQQSHSLCSCRRPVSNIPTDT